MADNKPKQKPSKSFYFNGVSAAVFSRERTNRKTGEIFMSHSVNLTESFLNKDGEREYTPFISARNLPAAMFVLQQAAAAIMAGGYDVPEEKDEAQA